MIYFKVKPESDFYTKIQEAKAMKAKWFEYKDKLYTSVGLSVIEELAMSTQTLYYPGKVPEELLVQFKKHKENGCYIAKANSTINKQWQSLCKEYGLKFVNSLPGMIQDELFKTPYAIGHRLKRVIPIGNDIYLDGERELPQADFLEVVTEADYLKARLEKAETA
jgi:hypothetical protein